MCFCDRCLEGFRGYLKSLPEEELRSLGIPDPQGLNYRELVQSWLDQDSTKGRKPTQHPLWPQWTIYQCRAAAAFMQELRETAQQTAGRPVPVGANAGLLWPRHLADYRALDLFSAETDHHAGQRQFSDHPLFAYRLADSVQRPYASTASGGDWAFIKEHNLPGLVRGWIALSYAAGHAFMAPHRQWCHTPEKGTHWYEGPASAFAPLYRFVREHAAVFDRHESYADIAIVLPHRSFAQRPDRWFELCQQMATRNVSYRLLLGGDEIVDHPLSGEELRGAGALLIPNREDLSGKDRGTLDQCLAREKAPKVFATASEALAALTPAVRVSDNSTVRALPRLASGSAAIHLLNLRYDPARDEVTKLRQVVVRFDHGKLGLSEHVTCSMLQPERPSQTLAVAQDQVAVPELGLWSILLLQDSPGN